MLRLFLAVRSVASSAPKWTGAVGLLLATSILAEACFAPTNEGGRTVFLVGTQGGTFEASSGVRLEVPAGALAAEVQLSIAPTTTSHPDAIGQAWLLGPEGQRFAEPIALRLPLERAPTPSRAIAVATSRRGSSAWQSLAARQEGLAAQTRVEHFSVFVPVEAPPTDSGVQDPTGDGGIPSSDGGQCAPQVTYDGGRPCTKLVTWTQGLNFVGSHDGGAPNGIGGPGSWGAHRTCITNESLVCYPGGECICSFWLPSSLSWKSFPAPALPGQSQHAFIQSLFECQCGFGPSSTVGSPPVAWGTPTTDPNGYWYLQPFGAAVDFCGRCEWGACVRDGGSGVCSKYCPGGDCPSGTTCVSNSGSAYNDPYTWVCQP